MHAGTRWKYRPMKTLTQKRLKELLHYDPDTGIFTRKVKVQGRDIGSIAGGVDKGYWRISVDGKRYRANRLAFLYMTGEFPKYFCDHINEIRLDDRWINLRDVTNSQNLLNRKNANIDSKTGLKGIHWCNERNAYVVSLTINKHKKNLGRYKAIEDAIKIRNEMVKKYYPIKASP